MLNKRINGTGAWKSTRLPNFGPLATRIISHQTGLGMEAHTEKFSELSPCQDGSFQCP